MKIVEVEDRADLGRKAAEIVIRQLLERPNSVITFPTGNTPLPLFRELVAASKTHPHLFEQARFVTLDEYAGIARNDRRRLLSWLSREFLVPAAIREQQVIAFDSTSSRR